MKSIVLSIIYIFFYINNSQAQSIIRDAEIESAITQLIKPIVAYSKLPNDKVKIRIILDDQINAFATTGMEIYIYSGLLVKDVTPSMMSGVLAHEIGHIVGGHLYKISQSNSELMAEALGLILLGGLASATSKSNDALIGSATLVAQLAERQSLRFSRMQEYQADNFAIKALNQSKYPINGFLGFFQSSRAFEAVLGTNPYSLTHPTGQDRIDNIKRYTNSFNISHNFFFNDKLLNSYRKAIIKFKAYLCKEEALLDKIALNMTLEEKQYAYAIFFHKQGEFSKAANYIQALLKDHGENPFYHETYSQILYEKGLLNEAIIELSYAQNLLPQNPLLNVELAHFEIQLASKNKEKKLLNNAISRLNFVMTKEGENTEVLRLLGKAYGEKGEQSLANLYFAKESLVNLDYKKTILFASRALSGLKKDTSDYWECQSILEEAKQKNYRQ